MATDTQLVTPGATTIAPDAVVYFDGAFLPLQQATVSVATHGLHYGTGTFEGLRGYWDEEQGELYVLKLAEHVDRFFRSCGVLRIQPPFDRDELSRIILTVLRENNYCSDVYIRPIGFKSAQTIKLTLSTLSDSFAVFAFPFGHYAHREGGLNVCVSPWLRIDDTTIPTRAKVTGGYINAALASDEAARAGFDEALMMTSEGTLSEASSANVFLVRNGTLVTPSLSDNILEGITRDAVIELARRELNLPVEERQVGRTEIYVADEMFLTGTGVQIEPIAAVDGRPVGSGKPGPVTTSLQALYAAAVRKRLPAYAGWCTPVYGA